MVRVHMPSRLSISASEVKARSHRMELEKRAVAILTSHAGGQVGPPLATI